MNYRKSVSTSNFVSIVDGKKHQEKDLYVRENIGDKTTFLKHMEVGNKSKSMAGTTYDDRMAVVTRVSDGNRVKYSSDVVKSANNLRRVLKKSLRLNKKAGTKVKRATKGKVAKRATKGKVARRGTKGKKGTVAKKSKVNLKKKSSKPKKKKSGSK